MCLGIQELSLSPMIWTPHISTNVAVHPVTRPIEQELF